MLTTLLCVLAFCPPEELPAGDPNVEELPAVSWVESLLHGGLGSLVYAGNDPSDLAQFVVDPSASDLPPVWIGVRLTPIPAPLAAHVGPNGLMIANVVKDSPADQAGLQQYDVVLEFNGQAIAQPRELVDAIGALGAGKTAEMKILRGGQEQPVQVTPRDRSDSDPVEFKYEEENQDVIDNSVSLRGRTLRLGPDGKWTIRDLGPLRRVPDGLPLIDLFDVTDDADADAHETVTISVNEDGVGLTIRRDADGKFSVERTDEAGAKTEQTFDDAKAFEQGDAKAFETWRRFRERGGIIQKRVDIDQLPKLRLEFEQTLRDRLGEFQRQRETAMERARVALRDADSQLQRNPGDAGRIILRERLRDSGGDVQSEGLTIRTQDDGTIDVEVRSNDRREVYRFKDRAEFKASKPELFERVQKLFE